MSGAEAPIDNDGDEKKPEIAQNDAGAEPGHGGDLEPESPQAGGAIANDEVTVNVERVVVKFLIPNIAAGSIIGKGGASITDIQNQSRARMQLSKSNEFYPGNSESQDRILLVSGTIDQLLTALHLVLEKLKSEPAALRAVLAKDDKLQLRMLVHSRLCGTLIGKGGATIRSFNQDSKAAFNISPPPVMPTLTERIVKMTGDADELMRAVALVVTKLSENPDYYLLTDANLTYASSFPGMPSTYERQVPVHQQHPMSAVTMAISEDKVGRLIGKEGVVIKQIKELLNVAIKISRKGEYLPGTTNRACHISGAPDAVAIAQRLVTSKIEGRLNDHSGMQY